MGKDSFLPAKADKRKDS